MGNLIGELRYALRQFWVARIFTITAVLTLALGIGGTTAIFTLIHAVMLRSLPVSDPSRLYRIGDGDSCCVQGGPQDRWGMFSFPLYERLKAELPEFEEVTAFQAGGPRLSVRRQNVESTSRPLRSQYVTGTYFSTLGVRAFGGRVFNATDDAPAAPPVAVLSHHVWQSTYGADPSMVGATLVVEGHPFTVVGVTPPGFFGETLRGDPPDLWIPLQQEPLINGDTSILRQPDLGVAARDRPASPGRYDRRRWAAAHGDSASVDAARLGLSAELDARHRPGAAAAGDRGGARGRRRRHHEGAVRQEPADSARRCAGWCCSLPAPTSPTCCSRAR